ncbi:MAG TPA: multicopper oxidase domain-containing protein [Anaeromyxobacteraceae bacterium]|nr:multicopper oxidase domain-containing protein [Anaeromyxobacteraceae bacterium]
MSNRRFSRRDVLKITGAAGAAGLLAGKARGAVCADTSPVAIETARDTGCPIDVDLFPTSPFIVNPFSDPFVVPKALRPGYRNPDGTLSGGGPQDWTVRQKNGVNGSFVSPPGPGAGNQDAIGDRPMGGDGKAFTFTNPKTGALTTKTLNFGGARKGTHQLLAGGLGTSYKNLKDGVALRDGSVVNPKSVFDALDPNPLLYHIRLQVAEHRFTTSPVVSINSSGAAVPLPAGAAPAAAGTVTFKGATVPAYAMPRSTIYGFNGTFPGPMINATYGQPIMVRFENDLDFNPSCLNRGDFGAPDWAFLTHLHNGHTAPESDGQPHDMQDNGGGYQPGQWVDSSYLLYPAGGDDLEKQSFLWFHDHRMHHTGPNVYKGMVGLMPHYDIASRFNPSPQLGAIDGGDETRGVRLPGRRADNGDGTFDVAYDIPMAFYDFRTDDGITPHQDTHQPLTQQVWSNNVCGQLHPEWWGQLFHQHYPNHGFVGDIFTTNGVAYPVLTVERRRYRFRWLSASVSRQYELSFRQGNLVPAPGQQGQWSFGSVDSKGNVVFNLGTQVMKMTQVASGGGLLTNPVLRDAVEVWPAKRREVVVDFSVYMDGTKTKLGDVVYLTNTAFMPDGRKQAGNLTMGGAFAVPLVKIVIGSDALIPDASDPGLCPVAAGVRNRVGTGNFNANKVLRPRHIPPFIGNTDPKLENMDFTLQRGGSAGGETEWLINGLQFDPTSPMWAPTVNSFELWGVNNGGGGWTHPMHIHMEEHQVVSRTSGVGINSRPPHPEDPIGKEDLVALEPSEQTQIWRGFRTFLGNYVAHCHNLAHEDHNMMFGWSLTL